MDIIRSNIVWFLHELAVAEAEQFETGELEIICENDKGQESQITIEVNELAETSYKEIQTLQAENEKLKSKIAKAINAGVVEDDDCEETGDYLYDVMEVLRG